MICNNPRPALALTVALISASVLAQGCRKESPPRKSWAPRPKRALPDVAQKTTPPPDVGTPLPVVLAASHILVSYKGAQHANPGIKRSAKEAQQRAAEILARVIKQPEKFEEIARRMSDDPRSVDGGYLGTWRQGSMSRAFEEAVARLPLGKLSKVVSTPFGYHIIRREQELPETPLSAQHLVVTYKGALKAKPGITRTREEARLIALKLARMLNTRQMDFEAAVREHSDGPRAAQGGPLGVWTCSRGKMPPAFERAIINLLPDQVSHQPVESPFGFHIFKRVSVQARLKRAASHILIAYKGAKRARPEVKRTRAQALKLARKLAKEIRPDQFAAMARKHSDCLSRNRGGYLGTWSKGQMTPAFEEAVDALKMGEISPVVETAFGFHIILRQDVR